MNETNKTALDKLQARLERKCSIVGENEKLDLSDALEDALSDVLDYCYRDQLVGNMQSAVYDLAVIRLNREGTEGETSRSEGGVSISQEIGMPSFIRSKLNRYRIAKVRQL